MVLAWPETCFPGRQGLYDGDLIMILPTTISNDNLNYTSQSLNVSPRAGYCLTNQGLCLWDCSLWSYSQTCVSLVFIIIISSSSIVISSRIQITQGFWRVLKLWKVCVDLHCEQLKDTFGSVQQAMLCYNMCCVSIQYSVRLQHVH